MFYEWSKCWLFLLLKCFEVDGSDALHTRDSFSQKHDRNHVTPLLWFKACRFKACSWCAGSINERFGSQQHKLFRNQQKPRSEKKACLFTAIMNMLKLKIRNIYYENVRKDVYLCDNNNRKILITTFDSLLLWSRFTQTGEVSSFQQHPDDFFCWGSLCNTVVSSLSLTLLLSILSKNSL